MAPRVRGIGIGFTGFVIALVGLIMGLVGFYFEERWISVSGFFVTAIGVLIGFIGIIYGWITEGARAITGSGEAARDLGEKVSRVWKRKSGAE